MNQVSASFKGRLSLQGRDSHACGLMDNGEVLVAGGRADFLVLAETEIWNPLTGAWRQVRDMPDGVSHHGMVKKDGGNMLVMGGEGFIQIGVSNFLLNILF